MTTDVCLLIATLVSQFLGPHLVSSRDKMDFGTKLRGSTS